MKKRTLTKKWYLFFAFAALVILLSFILFLKHNQTELESVSHRLQWWLSAIEWDDGRTKETGEGVQIAVLDSGIDAGHPDLNGVITEEYRASGLGEGESGSTLHGTAVAGIIAGSPQNEKGVLGVAVNAKILSIDITDQDNGNIEIENLIEGIEYAVSQDVDIINISAGVKNASDELYQVIRNAYDKGIVIVAASGNYMEDDLLYPAKYEEVIAAGALSKDGTIISPTGNPEKKIVYLPGENIVTTSIDSGYTGINGTSAATPVLSGIIALMLEKNKTLTNDKILEYFESNTKDTITVRDCIGLK